MKTKNKLSKFEQILILANEVIDDFNEGGDRNKIKKIDASDLFQYLRSNRKEIIKNPFKDWYFIKPTIMSACFDSCPIYPN